MKITKKPIISFIFLLFCFTPIFLVPLNSTVAQSNNSLFESQIGVKEISQVYGNQKQDLRVLVGKIISIVLGFVGAIFLILAVFAGFKYMTSGGNEEKAKAALTLLRNAIIGLVIILLAWAITRMVTIMLSRAVNNAVDYTNYRNGLY